MEKPVLDLDNLIIVCDECGGIMNYKLYGSKMLEVYECPGCEKTVLKKDLQPEQIQNQKITLGKEKVTIEIKISPEELRIFQDYDIDLNRSINLILKDLANRLQKAESVYRAFSELNRTELLQKLIELSEEEDQHLEDLNKKSLEASRKMMENRIRVKGSKSTF